MQSAEPRPLTHPRDGVPQLVTTRDRLAEAAAALAEGSGPVAVDAERASGYRYGQRAFLVQLRRAGVGTVLIDPVPLDDLSVVGDALGDAEWVLHAANQDLSCLAEVGLRPGGDLFDTELGARLAGLEKVGLAAVVESLLGWQLAKEHSAVDWSTRPLPEPWLRYAALDVEVLIELRDALGLILEDQGKLAWAREEFAAVRDAPAPPPRRDPWRRTSGLHQIKTRRQLAVLRELWNEREQMARRRDIAPGRILPDRALVSAAAALPSSAEQLAALPVFSGPANRRLADRWVQAVQRGKELPETQLPAATLRGDGPPPPRTWRERDPLAAERLALARAMVAERSEHLVVPVENLLTPDALRRLCWRPPYDTSAEGLGEALVAMGARRWQVELLAGDLAAAFSAAEAALAAEGIEGIEDLDAAADGGDPAA